MPRKSAYDLDNATLLRNFSIACAKSGTANSGLVIDIGASSYVADVRYLKGVLLSRLEKLEPPFKEGVMVNVKKECREKGVFFNEKILKNLLVDYVHYNCDRKLWELQLREFEEKVPAEYCCLAT